MISSNSLAVASLIIAAMACDSTHSHDSGSHHDSGHGTHSETCGETGETYTAGMSHTGDLKAVEFVLVAADPAPPDKGENIFTVSISDVGSGVGIDGATVIVTPYMPEHGHGTNPADFGTEATGDAGTYQSEAIDLFMSGLWELTFSASSGDAVLDETTFTFCLEG